MIILQVDNVTPDELWFALLFLALVMVCVAVDKVVEANRKIKAIRFITAYEAGRACAACAGTGKGLVAEDTAAGTRKITKYTRCAECHGTGVAA